MELINEVSDFKIYQALCFLLINYNGNEPNIIFKEICRASLDGSHQKLVNIGWLVLFYFLWFADPPTVSKLSPTGEGQVRGVDLIDITSSRVAIVKLWVGEFSTFFISVYTI